MDVTVLVAAASVAGAATSLGVGVGRRVCRVVVADDGDCVAYVRRGGTVLPVRQVEAIDRGDDRHAVTSHVQHHGRVQVACQGRAGLDHGRVVGLGPGRRVSAGYL